MSHSFDTCQLLLGDRDPTVWDGGMEHSSWSSVLMCRATPSIQAADAGDTEIDGNPPWGTHGTVERGCWSPGKEVWGAQGTCAQPGPGLPGGGDHEMQA